MCSQALAFSLGALVAYSLTTELSPQALENWGWRLPFLAGILIGPVGWLIRSRVDESPEFLAYAKDVERGGPRPEKTPIRTLLADYRKPALASIGVAIVGTVSAYVFVFFLPIFARKQLGIAADDVNLSTCLSTVLIVLLCPIAGHLSDRYGRKAVLIPAITAYGIAAFPLFHQLVSAPSFGSLLMVQLGVSVLMSFFWGVTPVTLTEIFPVSVRSTGAAVTYNIAVLIFGGLAPFVNIWLVQATGSKLAPIYYVELSVLLGIAGTLLLPSTARTRPIALTTSP